MFLCFLNVNLAYLCVDIFDRVAFTHSIFYFRRTKTIKDYLINEQIRDREVVLIDSNGVSRGLMSTRDAMAIAEEQGLDLVKVGEGRTPTCKLMDYAKWVYDKAKKEKEQKKAQKKIEIKEIQLSVTIDTGDLRVKANKTNEFISDGDKVRVVIRMRGRQNVRPELGLKVMNEFYKMIENANMEQAPAIEGNTIRMTLAPQTKK